MNSYKELLSLLIVLILASVSVSGQELKVGDTLPDYTFGSVLRYSTPSIRLSAFRGKILVLDFWRTTCGHAVASFAHFDSLQRAFPGRIAVMALTTESRERIADYLTNNAYAKETAMPVITDDTLLAGKRISFFYIPHVVLADERGVIVAMTDPERINHQVIEALLEKQTVALPVKHEVTDFNYDVPVFEEGKGRNLNGLAYTSVITHQLPGVLEMTTIDSSDKGIFYKAYNQNIAQLYAQAFHITNLKPNRLVVPRDESNRFYNPAEKKDKEWEQHNLWCYNLILPSGYVNPERYAVEDFNRFFGVKGYIEKQRVKCLLLVRKGTEERWKAKPSNEYVYADSAGYTIIRNVNIFNLAEAWDANSSLPILNQSGLMYETADMTVKGTPNQLTAFRKELQRYNLDLIPSVREVAVLVIKKP